MEHYKYPEQSDAKNLPEILISSKKMENCKLKKIKIFLKVYIKMENTIIKFGDLKIKKQKYHQNKRPISIKNVDINKRVVFNKVSFGKKGFKYFIGYKDLKKSLCVYFSQK